MENRDDSLGHIKNGLLWTFGERITAQLVTTFVTIVLARILTPHDYGIISIVMVFISFCNVFVGSGMGSALVQKREADSDDYNTAFVLEFLIAICLYILLFLSAPMFAKFYDMAALSAVIRVMGVRLPIAALNNIQHARIQRNMSFKKFFIATSFGTMISGIAGIVMALSGGGIWALVGQYLTNTIVDTIALIFIEHWFPKFRFSVSKAKEIFSFGWKVLATELTYTLGGDIRILITGKFFGSTDLAYFEQGKKYPALIVSNVNSSLNKVMLPAYSRKQENIVELKLLLRKSIRIGAYIMTPLLVGLAVVSETLVPLFMTEKWNGCVPFIQIFCITYLTRPIETACHQALLGIGKSGIVLKIMIMIVMTDVVSVLAAAIIFHSVFMIAVGALFSQIVSLTLFSCQIHKWIRYRLLEQLADIVPIIIASTLMGIITYAIGKFIPILIIRLLIQAILGIVVYFLISLIFKFEGFFYLTGIIRKVFHN